jgi:pimeloyl-ACP methyl ester carboxylesterase
MTQDTRVTTQQVRVDGVDIEYTDTGVGPTIVFVHGVYVTGALWQDVVDELGDGVRCVVPTWPRGAHNTTAEGTDLGAEAAARRIVHFIEASIFVMSPWWPTTPAAVWC